MNHEQMPTVEIKSRIKIFSLTILAAMTTAKTTYRQMSLLFTIQTPQRKKVRFEKLYFTQTSEPRSPPVFKRGMHMLAGGESPPLVDALKLILCCESHLRRMSHRVVLTSMMRDVLLRSSIAST
jgi:hypothetical protein